MREAAFKAYAAMDPSPAPRRSRPPDRSRATLGILIAGLAGMVPERRAEIAGLGLKSIVGGTLATMMTGAVVGLLTG
jgi:hypothetical protein